MKNIFRIILFLVATQFSLAQVNAIFSTKNSDFTLEAKDVYKVIKSIESISDFGKPGAPQLPIFSRNYALPQGSVVTSLSYINGAKIEMGGVVYICIQTNRLVH